LGHKFLGVLGWIKYQFVKGGFPKTKSLALPLSRAIDLQTGNPRVAVVLHLFYLELATEIASYLANIPLPFDLYISTDTKEKKRAALAHQLCKLAKHTDIRIVPNRGRDIAPKLITFAAEYGKYDLLLFIHSKQSLFDSALADWRKVIFEQLLGNRTIVENTLGLFNAFPNLGMIAPSHFEPILFAVNWGPNWKGANRLATRMGLKLDRSAPLDFPSGSMFWARPQALMPLIKLNFSHNDFEPENGQTDGALGHQIERLFYFSCEKAGYAWLKISCPELFKRRLKFVEAQNLPEIEALFEQKLSSIQH
jgi:lipopolysaccharide biosynthesis protein